MTPATTSGFTSVTCVATPGISQAAGYRYLHEGIDISPAKPRTCTRPWTGADARP